MNSNSKGLPLWFHDPKECLCLFSCSSSCFVLRHNGPLYFWRTPVFLEVTSFPRSVSRKNRKSLMLLPILFLRGDPEKSERKYEYSNISDKKYPSLSSLPLIPPFWNAMIYLPYFVFCSLKRTLSIAYRRRNMMWLWGALTEDKYGRTLQQHWILFSSRNLA